MFKEATEQYYINKIAELEKKIAYYENPCMFCGADSWSTYVCDSCIEEHNRSLEDVTEEVIELLHKASGSPTVHRKRRNKR